MTQAEVELILGPPGNYQSGPTESDPSLDQALCAARNSFGRGEDFESATTLIRWSSDTLFIFVALGPNGTVVAATPMVTKRVHQGPLDNLLWRAKRHWRRWFPE
jgi:hypothetical protein